MSAPADWAKKNQEYLVACIDQVKELLRSKIEKGGASNAPIQYPDWRDSNLQPAIEYVCETFGLSRFERLMLVICAAVELDSELSQLCAKAHGNPSAAFPTFSLALSIFPDAHWSALAPASPLRRFRLIDLYGLPQVPLTKCQVQIEERVLHYIAGLSYLDSTLQGTMQQMPIEAPIGESQKQIGSDILHAWKSGRNPFHIQLVGPDEVSKRVVAGWACRQLGMVLWQMHGDLVPQQQSEIEQMARIWTRESALMNAGLYITAPEMEPASHKLIKRFMNSISGPIFLSTIDPLKDSGLMLSFEVDKPTKIEQLNLWKKLVPQNGAFQADGEIMRVVNQFNLNTSSIQMAASEAALAVDRGQSLRDALWSASRGMARPRLQELAQRIIPKASMDDLVLPDKEKQLLRSIVASVRQRYRVYEEWGFADYQRGLGIAALFSGDSGTGKTMAAEVLAKELELDLFRIDLSMVVNKYIGETEKNLRKIFDAAEDGGAILLFDEADSLFGKRGEVREGVDRYSNIEVDYLLQRVESYRGLAVLTTNMKEALDKAFLRRLRFVVNFPFPNEKSRKEIWKRVFPKSVPLGAIDYDRLAQLDLAGGHIRNIALGASIMAADQGTAVGMRQIAGAAKEEYDKMERPMPSVRWAT